MTTQTVSVTADRARSGILFSSLLAAAVLVLLATLTAAPRIAMHFSICGCLAALALVALAWLVSLPLWLRRR
ncbi:hypothetical protein KRX56_03490 [Dermabacteraceae bacterium TAE3-ERU27]|nr:hypothetical protein [Dermabacteraceae bacterium TAE3-ERU27]